MYSRLSYPTRNLDATYYMLHATCYILHATCYMLYAPCYMLHATCYMLHITFCYMLHSTCYMLHATCYILLHASCYRLYATSYMLNATYYRVSQRTFPTLFLDYCLLYIHSMVLPHHSFENWHKKERNEYSKSSDKAMELEISSNQIWILNCWKK